MARSFGFSSDCIAIDDATADVFSSLVANDIATLRAYAGRSSLVTYLAVIATRCATRNFARKRYQARELQVYASEAKEMSLRALSVDELGRASKTARSKAGDWERACSRWRSARSVVITPINRPASHPSAPASAPRRPHRFPKARGDSGWVESRARKYNLESIFFVLPVAEQLGYVQKITNVSSRVNHCSNF